MYSGSTCVMGYAQGCIRRCCLSGAGLTADERIRDEAVVGLFPLQTLSFMLSPVCWPRKQTTATHWRRLLPNRIQGLCTVECGRGQESQTLQRRRMSEVRQTHCASAVCLTVDTACDENLTRSLASSPVPGRSTAPLFAWWTLSAGAGANLNPTRFSRRHRRRRACKSPCMPPRARGGSCAMLEAHSLQQRRRFAPQRLHSWTEVQN